MTAVITRTGQEAAEKELSVAVIMAIMIETGTEPQTIPWMRYVRLLLPWCLAGAALLWALCVLLIITFRWVDPPTTAVQAERRMQSWFGAPPYHKRSKFVPLNQISPNLQHSVIAAEDGRFYQHHGFDWHAIQLAADEDMEGGRRRGGS